MRLEKQVIANIFSSWVGYLVRLTITFFFVPFIAGAFGDERYGVWVILFQTITYFTFFDFGLASALTRYVPKFLSKRDYVQINKVIGSANFLYLLCGILVFAGVYLFVTLFFDYFKISTPSLVEEGKNALLILGAYMALSFALLPTGNSLSSFQRHDIVRYLGIAEELVRVLLMVWLINRNHGLVALAVVVAAVSIVRHLIGMVILKKLHPQIAFSYRTFDKETVNLLFKYSRISFGITLGWLVVFNTDSFLLGILSSSAAAGIYNPAAQLMLYIRNLVNAIGVPLIPAVAHLEAESASAKIRGVYLKGVKYVSYFGALLAVGVIAFAHPFVRLWLPAEFASSAEVMIILAVGTAAFLPQIIGNSILFGCEKHRIILAVVVGEAVTKIILSLWLVRTYGYVGMALATAVPQAIFYLTIYPILVCRFLRISYLSFLKSWSLSTITAVAAALAGAAVSSLIVKPETWMNFFVGAGLTAAIGLLPLVWLTESEDKELLKRSLRSNANGKAS